MKNFEGFGLSKDLNESLSHMNYSEPTPIQAKAIPMALQGRDIMGTAQTGTGKTAAFSIPLVEKILRSPRGNAIVLTPTRELAKQVLDVIHQLLPRKSGINTAFIIGGEAYGKQHAQLRARPRIVVGTPGRINDHLESGSLMLNETDFLVLDETDRMLDMGFGVQLDKIITFLPKNKQTLMFSATLPDGILKLSSKYLKNPERISMGETNTLAKNITQDVIRIDQGEKYKELMLQLHDRNGSVIVFVKTKYNADKMAKNLRRDGFTSDALHGDLRQNKRDKVMSNFRSQNFRVLIATDIAARGLDVPHIEHVINYDLPQVAEDYIHRMGRTARAGAEGSALSFVSPQDGRKWHAIQMLLDPDKAANDRGFGFSSGKEKKRGRKKPYHGRPAKSEGGYKGKAKRHRGEGSEAQNSPERQERQERQGRPERQEGEQRDARPAKKHRFARADVAHGDKSKHSKKRSFDKSESGFKGKPKRHDGDKAESGFKGKPKKRHEKHGSDKAEGGFKGKPNKHKSDKLEGGFKGKPKRHGPDKPEGGFKSKPKSKNAQSKFRHTKPGQPKSANPGKKSFGKRPARSLAA